MTEVKQIKKCNRSEPLLTSPTSSPQVFSGDPWFETRSLPLDTEFHSDMDSGLKTAGMTVIWQGVLNGYKRIAPQVHKPAGHVSLLLNLGKGAMLK